jgi:tetratricopeptide (TPR) repeat protein
LGNARLILEDYAAAEEAYLAMLAVRPGFAAAHNNLAFTLAKQGRFQAALEEISSGLEQATDQLLVDELTDTRAMIELELKNTAEGLPLTD